MSSENARSIPRLSERLGGLEAIFSRPIERVALAAGVFSIWVASLYIAFGAYVTVNGSHIWKQTDVYSTIMGLAGAKDYEPFQLFDDEPTVFNIPFYHLIVAGMTRLTQSEISVSVVVLGIVTLIALALSGALLLFPRHGVLPTILFVVFISFSPLHLHYFSVPIPDPFGTLMAVLGFGIVARIGMSWRGILAASVPLALATMTRPVITFAVLIWFLFPHVLLPITQHLRKLRAFRPHLWPGFYPMLALGFFLLALAILTEQLRFWLVGKASDSILRQGSDRYFGSWDMRLDSSFWSTMIERIELLGPFSWLYAALWVTGLFTSFLRIVPLDLRFSMFGSWASYLIGWLMFPLLYRIHDHYQLQNVTVTALALAPLVVFWLRILKRWFARRGNGRRNLAWLISVVGIVAVAATASNYPVLSERNRLSPWAGVEYQLRNETAFLYVHPEPLPSSPVIGGLVSTSFTRIALDDFERDCELIVARGIPIIVRGDSDCLAFHRESASVWFPFEDHLLFIGGEE